MDTDNLVVETRAILAEIEEVGWSQAAAEQVKKLLGALADRVEDLDFKFRAVGTALMAEQKRIAELEALSAKGYRTLNAALKASDGPVAADTVRDAMDHIWRCLSRADREDRAALASTPERMEGQGDD